MKKLRLKKGFTLIELLVSIVIFVMFLGIVSSSYVNIVRAQREANEVRRMYSDVRNFVDSLSEEVRLGTIDYECYLDVTDSAADVTYDSATICPGGFFGIADGRSTDLALVRKDGLQKTIFHYDSTVKEVTVKKFEKDRSGVWSPAPGFNAGVTDAMGATVQVESLSFAINPDVNPYSQDNYYKNEKQFQPKVTVFMKVKNGANTKSQFSLDFQTSISSRVYSRL